MPTTPRTGVDEMRHWMHEICGLASRKSGVIAAIALLNPDVATALQALIAICQSTGFDKIPELHHP